MSQQVWLLADWLAAKAPDFATGRLPGAQISSTATATTRPSSVARRTRSHLLKSRRHG